MLLLLAPSAYVASRTLDMPGFGDLQDDGLYFTCAKSIAEHGSYRILFLPEAPVQTKYPPLYPWVLSWIWRFSPSFPENLRLGTALSWLLIPLLLYLSARLFRAYGFSGWRLWTLLGVIALNPYVAQFGTTLFSEMFFTCLLLMGLLSTSRRPFQAGLFGAVAYLTRSAGIAWLGSQTLYWLWTKRPKHLVLFAAGMVPAVVGWTVWTSLHKYHTSDQALVYYVDYVTYEIQNVTWHNLHLVLWKNTDELLYGIGSLFVPKLFDSRLIKIIVQMIGIGAIVGTVRMARRGVGAEYVFFAAVSSALLVVWHYPPNERFVLPLLPLLAAGLLTEIERLATNVGSAMRHQERSQRVAAWSFGGAVGTLLGLVLLLQIYVLIPFLPWAAGQGRARLADQLAAYAWVRKNLPESVSILALNEASMFLYTGRRSMSLRLAPRFWYTEDHVAQRGAFRDIASYALDHHLDYVYLTTEDMRRDIAEQDWAPTRESVSHNPRLQPVFHAGIGTLYRVR